MSGRFWLNTLWELFIGVLLIFIAPFIQRWRDNRSIARGQKKTEKVRRHYSDVLFYALEPHNLTQYLIIQGILVGGALVSVILGMSLVITSSTPSEPSAIGISYWKIFWTIFGLFFAFSGTASLNRLTSRAVDLWAHSQSFDKYVASVPTEFRKPEVELLVREKLGLSAPTTVASPPSTRS
jgi:hypothetical protein